MILIKKKEGFEYFNIYKCKSHQWCGSDSDGGIDLRSNIVYIFN